MLSTMIIETTKNPSQHILPTWV